jgi:hypothetical protein
MLKKVPKDVALWCMVYLTTKPPHVGVDVDGLACPLHRPTTCSCQTRRYGLSARRYLVLLLQWAVAPF